jgi:hypothetical protein
MTYLVLWGTLATNCPTIQPPGRVLFGRSVVLCDHCNDCIPLMVVRLGLQCRLCAGTLRRRLHAYPLFRRCLWSTILPASKVTMNLMSCAANAPVQNTGLYSLVRANQETNNRGSKTFCDWAREMIVPRSTWMHSKPSQCSHPSSTRNELDTRLSSQKSTAVVSGAEDSDAEVGDGLVGVGPAIA